MYLGAMMWVLCGGRKAAGVGWCWHSTRNAKQYRSLFLMAPPTSSHTARCLFCLDVAQGASGEHGEPGPDEHEFGRKLASAEEARLDILRNLWDALDRRHEVNEYVFYASWLRAMSEHAGISAA